MHRNIGQKSRKLHARARLAHYIIDQKDIVMNALFKARFYP